MIFEDILKTSSNDILDDLINRYNSANPIDIGQIKHLAVETLRCVNARKTMPLPMENLLNRWYDSLHSGSPDYTVYGEHEYIAELWVCWKIYSRAHLLNIQKQNSLFTDSITNQHKSAKSIVDLGCGFAYTTAAISQIFPNADVIGTNLDGTLQMTVAKQMAKDYGFRMEPGPEFIERPVDLVFASEYFEHFINPLDHLDFVIESLDPRAMLVANAFGTSAIGHFREHDVKLSDVIGYEKIEAKATGKLFNDRMKKHGFKKVKTKLWNNRPAYWVKD